MQGPLLSLSTTRACVGSVTAGWVRWVRSVIRLLALGAAVAMEFGDPGVANLIRVRYGPLGVFGCGTARTGSSPDVLSRPSNFEGQQGTTHDSTVPTLDPEPNNLI
jgi:hypothetical protein